MEMVIIFTALFSEHINEEKMSSASASFMSDAGVKFCDSFIYIQQWFSIHKAARLPLNTFLHGTSLHFISC